MELGPLIIDVIGTQLTKEDKELLKHPLVGGLIFFSRNYENPEQLAEFCQSIRAVRPDAVIMVDQEGGRVQRFKDELTRLPSLRLLGRLWDAHPEMRDQVHQFAFQLGVLMAIEMVNIGVDLSLAPVVDLDKNMNEVIGERAFHSKPHEVTQLARSYIKGMADVGMAATIKHFPGHGSVTQDSHVSLPIDERSEAEIAEDLEPFKNLVGDRNVKAVMPAHVIYKHLDPLPACFSHYWLKEILRNTMKFEGAIISDDLTMQAAHVIGDYHTRADEALKAGCDVLLVCNSREGVIEILDKLKFKPSAQSVDRLLALRAQQPLSSHKLAQDPKWQTAKKSLKKFEGLCASLNPSLV